MITQFRFWLPSHLPSLLILSANAQSFPAQSQKVLTTRWSRIRIIRMSPGSRTRLSGVSKFRFVTNYRREVYRQKFRPGSYSGA